MVLQIWSTNQDPSHQRTTRKSHHSEQEEVEERKKQAPSAMTLSSPVREDRPQAQEAQQQHHHHKDVGKKRRGLLGLKSPFKFISGGGGGKTYCKGCKKKCSGEVLRVNDVYFHTQCFLCKSCKQSLSQGGFFIKDKDYYCAKCYQTQYGTKCHQCGEYVEGEVVSALGKTYHQKCFTCDQCKKPFPTGERVTFTGKSCLCQKCVHQDEMTNGKEPNGHTSDSIDGLLSSKALPSLSKTTKKKAKSDDADDICAGCNEELRDGQALMALNKQYHVWCFKCKACQALLHGEYMGKDGQPYCEKDYQLLFGVKCTYCRRFISGKVLQAGDNNHFHPTCARCTKCGEPFGDGEEMFLQGAAIWHPRCGPGPEDGSGGAVINGYDNNYVTSTDHADRASMASAPFYGSRASSPGASLSQKDRFSRSTTQMSGAGFPTGGGTLYSSSSTYSLRRPIEPGDRIGSLASINHFHIPAHRRASSSSYRHTPLPTQPPSAPMLPSSSRTTPQPSVFNSLGTAGPQHFHRPISCPPKPGYTHARNRPATGVSPGGAGSHFSHADDNLSQQSFRTDYTDPYSMGMRASSTYHHGFGGRTSRPETPSVFTGEHKTYPLHMVLTSNYKLPPDLDRCNLEKHLSDADFGMVFNMHRDEFYTLPLWRRNELKKRARLF